jgi:hypothetical protein
VLSLPGDKRRKKNKMDARATGQQKNEKEGDTYGIDGWR